MRRINETGLNKNILLINRLVEDLNSKIGGFNINNISSTFYTEHSIVISNNRIFIEFYLNSKYVQQSARLDKYNFTGINFYGYGDFKNKKNKYEFLSNTFKGDKCNKIIENIFHYLMNNFDYLNDILDDYNTFMNKKDYFKNLTKDISLELKKV